MTGATQAAEEKNFSDLAGQASKWVENVLGRGYRHYVSDDAWTPAMNLYEGDTCYVIVVDLAGVAAEEIELKTEKRMLMLSGRREVPEPPCREEGQAVRLRIMEIDHGRFCRSFELPKDANLEEVAASYRCGFLWIHIPKKA